MEYTTKLTLIGLYFSLTILEYVHGEIVGAFVLPHGGIALDPRNFNTTNKTEIQQANKLHEACLKVGHDIRSLNPEVIFLSTPHGIADYKNFLMYSNSVGSGFGDVDDCLQKPCQYNLTINLDSNIAERFFAAQGYSNNVSLLSAFGPEGSNNSVPLRWGEVIPLLLVNMTATVKVVILSQPTRRYTETLDMTTELTNLGRHLGMFLHGLTERVAVVISADLAHTHKADGPYGYSNASEPFDKLMGDWASTMSSVFIDMAAQYVDRALSCGYTGLKMLDGMFTLGTPRLRPLLYANLHPSYYGMMAASFLPDV
ncbi:protein CA_C1420-like [Mya arenaria]|uniref:protein CA_C1420-like n=1 Tax=Mya arenaria TaxID=6604 RepID=UPI0022E57CB4|nr:protein CA_C1420-like [Mya arenaria]